MLINRVSTYSWCDTADFRKPQNKLKHMHQVLVFFFFLLTKCVVQTFLSKIEQFTEIIFMTMMPGPYEPFKGVNFGWVCLGGGPSWTMRLSQFGLLSL